MQHPKLMRRPLAAAACAVFAGPAAAAGMDVKVEVPQLQVAEYHRPYVAVWIEREDRSVAAQLSLWYQQKKAGAGTAAPGADGKAPSAEGGTKWLPDLRQWWRRGGRELSVPADGLTGATRAAGVHELQFTQGKAPLGELAPGHYSLMVEAAREDGGRELLNIPFDWPAKSSQSLSAQGKTELGAISLTVQP